jgi:hypothetical protein
MSDAWLTPEEIHELTALKRWSAQCRALARMGIPFRQNAVGRPLVERDAVLKKEPSKSAKQWEPDWSSLETERARKTR